MSLLKFNEVAKPVIKGSRTVVKGQISSLWGKHLKFPPLFLTVAAVHSYIEQDFSVLTGLKDFLNVLFFKSRPIHEAEPDHTYQTCSCVKGPLFCKMYFENIETCVFCLLFVQSGVTVTPADQHSNSWNDKWPHTGWWCACQNTVYHCQVISGIFLNF